MWTDLIALVEKNMPSSEDVEQVIEYFKRRAKARLYADENFPRDAIELLREAGARVQTAQHAGLLGHADEDHAAHALRTGQVLLTCDRDYLNERRFPLIHCPAIFVFDFGTGTADEMRQAFRCLATIFAMPQFFDKWCKVDAKRDGWTEYVRHLDGTTSRTRLRLHKGVLQEWV
ncbi:MAG: hypothetical protein GC190_03250 [Alphaproteobacteria bacterium]|nr:hypothetical protein [Alphaproteobacteria bacterium]